MRPRRPQVVLAQVLHLTPEHAYVDTGFHSLSEVPRADLRVQHVQRPHASAPLAQRRGTSDVRCGDVVRLKVRPSPRGALPSFSKPLLPDWHAHPGAE